MKLLNIAIRCLDEFSRVQPGGALDAKQLLRKGEMPSMLRAANGMEVWFSPHALEHMTWLAQHLHQESAAGRAIRLEEYAQLVRQALVDGHCDGRLTRSSTTLLADVRAMVAAAVEASQRPLIHSFPAWSVDIGERVVEVGPAVIYPLAQWLERQRFTPKVAEAFFTDELPEEGWAQRFHEYLSGARAEEYLDPACMLSGVIGEATHVVEVAMPPRETVLSRHQARLLAQASLDCIALILERPVFHRHWVLRDQPTSPEFYDDITAFQSGLSPPNARKRFHRSPFSKPQNKAMLDQYASHVAACAHVLHVVRTDDQAAPNLGLAHRWLSALQWASEAAREPNDAMSSTKFATSLDILASASKSHPIVDMVTNLLRITADVRLVRPTPQHPEGMTLRQAVERLYGEGRSQVLHGNIVNPMHRHTVERDVGAWLARTCLRQAVSTIPLAIDAEHANFRAIPITPNDDALSA
ncbi:hypothetical protein ACQQ2N_17150 [Dokdonella sp. MW10]|uniref:hypothetical protein n=1 Tax=Dokdonella sp. MW10 TaxID=2992926 RepID=UPI003F801D0B